jgi:hypothetical protein
MGLRIFDGVHKVSYEFGGTDSVDHTMIAGERQGHHRADPGLAVYGNDTICDRAYCENCGLRLNDDSCEGVDSEHAEVADGKRAAGKIVGPEFATASALGEIAPANCNFAER